MDAVFSVLADNGAVKADLANVQDDSLHDGCHYLGDADNWDGEDRRWDNNVVRPFLRRMLVNAITKDDARFEYVCTNTTESLLVDYDAPVDVSDGPDGCAIISIACVGKADEGSEPMVEDGVPPPPGDDEGGCSTTHAGSGLVMWIGIAFTAFRRRRRSHAS
jgi:uncharacterized protein (TIGR03382 family)